MPVGREARDTAAVGVPDRTDGTADGLVDRLADGLVDGLVDGVGPASGAPGVHEASSPATTSAVATPRSPRPGVTARRL